MALAARHDGEERPPEPANECLRNAEKLGWQTMTGMVYTADLASEGWRWRLKKVPGRAPKIAAGTIRIRLDSGLRSTLYYLMRLTGSHPKRGRLIGRLG